MNERVTSVPHGVGLFVLRYVRCERMAAPPIVFVKPASGTEAYIQLITAPGASRPSARQAEIGLNLGSCVVVRAECAGALEVTVRGLSGAVIPEAELTFETLTGNVQGGVELQSLENAVSSGGVLSALAHVSRRGDVVAAPGEWIGGPDAPAPIEGFQLQLGQSIEGIGVEYQVLLDRSGDRWSDWIHVGGFAGTRGQARPLLGARIRLTGPRAALYQIEAEALFLGAPVMRAKGQNVDLVSGSNVDPLIGVKFALIGSTNSQLNRRGAAVAPEPHPRPAEHSRVRVFRAAGSR